MWMQATYEYRCTDRICAMLRPASPRPSLQRPMLLALRPGARSGEGHISDRVKLGAFGQIVRDRQGSVGLQIDREIGGDAAQARRRGHRDRQRADLDVLADQQGV